MFLLFHSLCIPSLLFFLAFINIINTAWLGHSHQGRPITDQHQFWKRARIHYWTKISQRQRWTFPNPNFLCNRLMLQEHSNWFYEQTLQPSNVLDLVTPQIAHDFWSSNQISKLCYEIIPGSGSRMVKSAKLLSVMSKIFLTFQLSMVLLKITIGPEILKHISM